jgi:murein DD-endopeptidase MepM/ murein hydrolase activator NlpD
LGVDIETQESAPVYAAADGTIAEVWEDPMMGQCVAVQHSGDAVSIYKNLALEMAEGVEAGTKVTSGQLLGYVGESAMTELADEPHLHFELTVAGLQVDPLEYMDKEAVATLSSSAYEDAA